MAHRGDYNPTSGGACCATVQPGPHMITVANRATPQPLTQEQQENAMTSEGAPPSGQMPEPEPPLPPPGPPTVGSTLTLRRHPQRGPDAIPS